MIQACFSDTSVGIDMPWNSVGVRGLELAALLFHKRLRDQGTAERLIQTKDRYPEDPMIMYGLLKDLYRVVFEHLPKNPRLIMDELCSRYMRGIRIKDLAKATFLDERTCSSTIRRMTELKMMETSRKGRETLVRQADDDFLQYYAICVDGRFREQFQGRTKKITTNEVREFMEKNSV